MVNQTGDIVSSEGAKYGGTATVPTAGAAFQTTTDTSITGQTAVGTVGNDTFMWRQVN
jgi:hypothetical protein